jgi:hypothetical protein
MKYVVVAVACLSLAPGLCTADALAASVPARNQLLSGPLPPSPFASTTTSTPAEVSPLLARETAVFTNEGLPADRAKRAIGIQSAIAQVDLPSKLEGTMGDAYAGVWFEPAAPRLQIGVASPAGRQTAARVVAATGLADNVTEIPVRSTWAQLVATQSQWNRKLANLFARSEVKTAIAPQRNAVLVTLGSAVPAVQRTALVHAATRAKVNVLINTEPTPDIAVDWLKSTACNPFATKAAYCDKPLTAGVSIGNTNFNCTGGPLAIPSGPTKNSTYMLTAGHCTLTKGEVWRAWNRAKIETPFGRVLAFNFATKGDWGEIPIEVSSWMEPDSKDPVFAVVAEWGTKDPTKSYPVDGERAPVVGNADCHSGQAAGQSCGRITALNVMVSNSKTTVGGLFEVEGGSAEYGDSGGPVYAIVTKNELLMEGIISAASSSKGNQFFQPLGPALKSLGLELLTQSNEVRP